MLDNLNVHHHEVVKQMIVMSGHRCAYRAPYWPKDGPIEFVFNAVEGHLRTKSFEINDEFDLEEQIRAGFSAFPDFTEFFRHVGFR